MRERVSIQPRMGKRPAALRIGARIQRDADAFAHRSCTIHFSTLSGSLTATLPTTTRARRPHRTVARCRHRFAHATTGLHAQRSAADRRDHAQIIEIARARTVQIDKVQPLRAGGRGILLRQQQRLDRVLGFACEVALGESDNLAAAQIDRWQ